MDWNLVSKYLFNNISLEFYLTFYIFAIIGMTFTMLIHFQSMKSRKKKANLKINFDFSYWIKKNAVRFLANSIAVFLFVRFPENLKIGSDLSMFLGFIIGLSIDGAILLLRNLKIGTN